MAANAPCFSFIVSAALVSLNPCVASERTAAYRALFMLEPLPKPGTQVQALVEDDRGAVDELEALHWPYLGWIDAVTLLPVDGAVLGWRWHPFKTEPAVDYSTWSRAEIERAVARLVSLEDEHPAANDPDRQCPCASGARSPSAVASLSHMYAPSSVWP